MAPLDLKLLLLSLAGLYRITRASDTPQSITTLPAYSQQRECATWCFFNGNRGEDLLGHAIGCCTADCAEPVANSCYCRADLRPSAVSWLSLCVDTQCSTNAVDVSSAVALYDDYCGAAVTATVAESASKSEPEPTQVTTRTVTTEPPATARTVVSCGNSRRSRFGSHGKGLRCLFMRFGLEDSVGDVRFNRSKGTMFCCFEGI
ncbi:hypothetical protein B0J13DRAFT_631665 [Dactylonectria estremocensis]|uniref:Extracellular membrane protein CFEM domain-containing protein n=1 Tax=Dactylonectria estremocensis TaxID=1079267 RepID=A0A9P9D1W4_9HYPO|nr:hypothetical protein B0J13DRAFT_631665 [Dactylonectria estremocensis]